MKNRTIGKVVLFIIGCVAMFLAVTGIVMWLWNCLLPEIFGVKTITFWQAMGILVLSKILFGGFGGKHGKGCGAKEKFRKFKEEHYSGMSEDEKMRLKEIWKKRCEKGDFFRKSN